MELRKILSVIIIISLAGAFMMPFASADKTELYSEVFDMTKVKADKENGVVKEIEVPDGDYKVTVTTGGDKASDANIYINGGERVRAYKLEAKEEQINVQWVVPLDGKITVQVLGENPSVTEIKVEQLEARTAAKKPTIYIAGDSTAQTYDYTKVYPQTGWGQMLPLFFTDDVEIVNRSIGGRSAKSYNNDGRLDAILTEMHPGDYVFIQFGINDGDVNKPERYISVEDYTALIKDKYLAEVEKRGGYPVLMTASAASWWDEENNCFMESRQDYADPTREIAKETGCLFIDANRIETDTWNAWAKFFGKKYVFDGYYICEPLESKAYPTGTDDHTHLKAKGAKRMAKLIADAIPESVPELVQYLKADEVFTDIKGHWAEKYITNVQENGLVDGQGDGKFNPDANVTRAEFLKMAMDAAGIVGHAYRDGECLDATTEDWYCYYLQGALDRGLLPEEMLSGALEGSGYVLKKHIETKTLAEATDDKEAVTEDIYVYEYENSLPNPAQSYYPSKPKFFGGNAITREEMAAILYPIADVINSLSNKTVDFFGNNDKFSDEVDINEKYKHAVYGVYTTFGLVNGMGDGTFAPQENLTRAQATVVINNLLEFERIRRN